MSTALAETKIFQDKIKERLRKDIGELIPDELLTTMVQQAIQDMFFCTKEPCHSWQQPEPSWFVREVESLLKEDIQSEIRKYMDEHREEMITMVGDMIANGAKEIVAELLIEAIKGLGYQMGNYTGMNLTDIIMNRS